MKKIVYKKAQSGKMLGSKTSGVVVSKKDEQSHPEDFKYLTKKEKSAGNVTKKTVSTPTKKVTTVSKKKSGGAMGKCRGGCN